jgi:hypothetical protein
MALFSWKLFPIEPETTPEPATLPRRSYSGPIRPSISAHNAAYTCPAALRGANAGSGARRRVILSISLAYGTSVARSDGNCSRVLEMISWRGQQWNDDDVRGAQYVLGQQ